MPKLDTFGILKNKINKLEDDKFKNKIFEAITDMINCDSLDTKITAGGDNIINDLIKIKTVRNSLKIKKSKKYYQYYKVYL